MAFTNAEKTKIRRYLGFSELWKQIDMRLESQLDALPLTNPDAETEVRTTLTRIVAIDEAIQSKALTRLDASEIIGEVKLLGPAQLTALRAQGRMLVNQIAITFSVEPFRDYFDEGGGSMGGMIQMG